MIKWERRAYSKETFITVWNTSKSVRQVAKRLGCAPTGGTYISLCAAAKDLGLSKSHMLGRAWSKGLPGITKLTLQEVLAKLTKHSHMQSYKLKNHLFEVGLKEKRCERCNNTEWLGEPIPTTLHHINGDKTDNRFENLMILCCNCHGLTENYTGKNKGTKDQAYYLVGKRNKPKVKKLF